MKKAICVKLSENLLKQIREAVKKYNFSSQNNFIETSIIKHLQELNMKFPKKNF